MTRKIVNKIITIDTFYKKKLNRKPIFGITGLNPHCESNFNNSEEEKIINKHNKFTLYLICFSKH